jgi:hypothetical protein
LLPCWVIASRRSINAGRRKNEWASVPPTEEELNVGDGRAARDWKTGLDLLNTCMETHKTETYADPSQLLRSLVPVLAAHVRDGEQGPRSRDCAL